MNYPAWVVHELRIGLRHSEVREAPQQPCTPPESGFAHSAEPVWDTDELKRPGKWHRFEADRQCVCGTMVPIPNKTSRSFGVSRRRRVAAPMRAGCRSKVIGSLWIQVLKDLSAIEIGHTFLARAYWNERTNRGVESLMLDHAFTLLDLACLCSHRKHALSGCRGEPRRATCGRQLPNGDRVYKFTHATAPVPEVILSAYLRRPGVWPTQGRPDRDSTSPPYLSFLSIGSRKHVPDFW